MMIDEQKNVNVPEKTFRAAPLSVTVWNNEIESPERGTISLKSIKLERSYKDKDDQWQKTSALRIVDLPKAVLLLNKAYEYLTLKEEEEALSIDEV